MRIVELNGIAREAKRTARAARLLAKFHERVSEAPSAYAVSLMRQMELVAGGAAWKMKLGGNGYRLIFTLETTPKGVPFAVVHYLVPHDEYDRRIEAGDFAELGRRDLSGQAEVAQAIDELDSEPEPAGSPARRLDGLRFSFDVIHDTGGHTVRETADWVDKVLVPMVESSDRTNTWRIASGIVNAGNLTQTTVDEDTEIVRVDDSTLVTRVNEDPASAVRRAFPLPGGPNAVERLVRIHEAATAQVDPFLVLHPSQRDILEGFRDRPFGSLPAAFDGPGGSGKSAVLLLLVKGILRHRGSAGSDATVHMLTASPRLAADLRRNLENHLVLVEGYEDSVASATASDVCLTLDDYFLGWLGGDGSARFGDPLGKVTWPRFRDWYEDRAWHDGRAHETWCALRSVIDGDREGRDDPPVGEEGELDEHIRQWFSRLPERRRQGLDEATIASALQVRRRYVEWKKDAGLWDDADLVDAFMDAIDKGSKTPRTVDLVVVDEAQDLTPDMIRGVIRTSSSFSRSLIRQDDREEASVSLPFLFAADDLQTINPSGFSWTGFRAVFYEESTRMLGGSGASGIEPQTLGANFRMRENVYDVALSLRRWMKADTAGSPADALRRDGFSGPVGDARDVDVVTMVGTASRVLIPDWARLNLDEARLLEKALGPKVLPGSQAPNPRWGKVLTATEAKGQEFKSAVLLGFGDYVRQMSPPSGAGLAPYGRVRTVPMQFRFAQQVTYVAASRVRDVAVWLDLDRSAEHWFWSGDAPYSPAPELSPKQRYGRHVIDEMRETASEKTRDGRIALETALQNVDLDRHDRAAAARAAAAAFGEAEEFELQDTAVAIGRYLDPGDTSESLRIADLSEAYRQPMVRQVCSDGAWYAFDSPLDSSFGADLISGAAVFALRQGDRNRAVATLNLGSFGVGQVHPEIVREMAGAWAQVVEHLADGLGSTAAPPLAPTPGAISLLESLPGAEPMVLDGLVAAMQGDLEVALMGLSHVPPGMRQVRAGLSRWVLSRHSGISWLPPEAYPDIPVVPGTSIHELNDALEAGLEMLVRSETFRKQIQSMTPDMFEAMPVRVSSRVLAEHLGELALSLVGSGE